MKKKSRLNNKGFALVETLIVAVAIVTIFQLIFKHFYPLIGEYERREDYDDIDSKYGTYWIKKMIQSPQYQDSNLTEAYIKNNGYVLFSCNKITDTNVRSTCWQLLKSLEVSCDNNSPGIQECVPGTQPHIYITLYSLKKDSPSSYDLKAKFKSKAEISDGLKEYLNTIPNYSKVGSLNKAKYRIVIEYYRHRFDTQYRSANVYEEDSDNDFKTYSTIEVKK